MNRLTLLFSAGVDHLCDYALACLGAAVLFTITLVLGPLARYLLR